MNVFLWANRGMTLQTSGAATQPDRPHKYVSVSPVDDGMLFQAVPIGMVTTIRSDSDQVLHRFGTNSVSFAPVTVVCGNNGIYNDQGHVNCGK